MAIIPFLILFTCLQVDLSALRQMGESDLKDMGVPMVGWKFTDFCLHHGSILASLRKSKYDLRLSPASILSYPLFQTSLCKHCNLQQISYFTRSTVDNLRLSPADSLSHSLF
jgi:hypothetical protein